MTEKICTKCKVSYRLSKFGKHIKSKDGFSHICKSCKSIANREFRRQNGSTGVMKNA